MIGARAIVAAYAVAVFFGAASLSPLARADAYDRAWALLESAAAQTEAGDKARARKNLAAAVRAAEGIENAIYRDGVLRGVAVALAEAGDFAAGKEIAATIGQAVYRAVAWQGIALAAARTDDFDGALSIAAAIERPFNRAEALREIGILFVAAGDKARAKIVFANAAQAAEKIPSAPSRADALARIAVALAQAR